MLKFLCMLWVSFALPISSANAQTSPDLATNVLIGERLASVLRAGRSVVAANQELINDPALGDKGLTSEAFLSEMTALYESRWGEPPLADMTGVAIRFQPRKPAAMQRNIVAIATSAGNPGHERIQRRCGGKILVGTGGISVPIYLDPIGPESHTAPGLERSAAQRNIVTEIPCAKKARNHSARWAGPRRVFLGEGKSLSVCWRCKQQKKDEKAHSRILSKMTLKDHITKLPGDWL